MKGARYADYVPVLLLVAGFVLIGLGYNGAAGLDYTQGQIPYMISGGILGLGLVFFGGAALLLQAIKKGQIKQLEQLESLNTSMHRLSTAMSIGSNGTMSTPDGELVVAGSASFHLATCRLVGERVGVERVSREEAETAGLKACRVCNP